MEDTTMKKIYINPEMAVINVSTQQMLAASVSVTIDGSQNNSAALGREDDDFDW